MTTDTNERHQQLLWFPMRITYGRTERMQRIKEMLEQEHLKCFLPMRVEFKKTDDFDVRKLTVPAVNGLIFVQASQEQLTQLKMTRREFEPMHYYTNHLAESGDDKILTIPDGQMENFMRAYTLMDDHVSLLEYTDFIAKPGKRVRVKEGIYENLVGTVKRIKKSQCIIVELEGFAAITIGYLPPSSLEELTEAEYQQYMALPEGGRKK